jgi:hypothetical protein
VDFLIISGNLDWYDTWKSIRVMPQNNGELCTAVFNTYGTNYNLGVKFEPADTITPEHNFVAYTSEMDSIQLGFAYFTYATGYGPWMGQSDKFLGVRFSLDEGVTYNYGWIRLDVTADFDSVTVKDYAYEETADKGIIAGSMSSLSAEKILNNNNIFAFSFGEYVIVNAAFNRYAEAEIYNLIGQKISYSRLNEGRNEIHVSNKGVYIVKLNVDGEVYTQKVIIQ